jgi:hypothetical protein
MADVLFIQEDYFKKLTGVDGNVDFKKIESTIIMVQDIYIQSLLGTPLYEDLKTKITANPSLSSYANEKLLIDNYIAKCLAWYIKAESSYSFKFAYQNKGIQVKDSNNSNAADTNDVQLLKDEWTLKAKAYGKLLIDYLVANTTLFPKYLEYTNQGMNASRKNYINGIYIRDNGIESFDEIYRRTNFLDNN